MVSGRLVRDHLVARPEQRGAVLCSACLPRGDDLRLGTRPVVGLVAIADRAPHSAMPGTGVF